MKFTEKNIVQKMLDFGFKFLACAKIQIRKFSFQAGNATAFRAVDKTKKLVYGGDLPIPTPRQSLGSILFNRLTKKERANDILQICTATKYRMTTKSYVEKAVALAERLKDEGIKKGDFIILVGNNSLNMNVALVGIFFLGAVPFPISYKTSKDEFEMLVRNVKPKYCACDRANLFTFQQVLKADLNYDTSKIFLLNHSVESDKSGFPTLGEFIKGRRKNVDSFKPVEVENPEEELALVVKGARHETYGKGIGITHHNLNSVITRFEAKLDEKSKIVELMVQKIMRMPGIYSLLTCCCFGSRLIVMNDFDEEGFLEAIEEYKVTSSYLYSSKLWQVYKYNYCRKYDLSSCQYIQAFDGILPPSLVSGMKEKFNLTLKSSFGINEVTGVALQSPDDDVEGSVGQLVPQLYGKVVLDKSLRKGNPYESGEIYFKGPLVTKGYINEPESTRRLFDKEGFIQSGLYGYFDNRGYFFIIDKIHHVIKYKQFKISPRELEGIIKSLKPVKDALVSGIRHPTDGFYPIAFVTPEKGQSITAEEIIKYVNGRVQDYQRLRGGVVFLAKIPRSRDTGALKRDLVRRVLLKYWVLKEVDFKEDSENASNTHSKSNQVASKETNLK